VLERHSGILTAADGRLISMYILSFAELTDYQRGSLRNLVLNPPLYPKHVFRQMGLSPARGQGALVGRWTFGETCSPMIGRSPRIAANCPISRSHSWEPLLYNRRADTSSVDATIGQRQHLQPPFREASSSRTRDSRVQVPPSPPSLHFVRASYELHTTLSYTRTRVTD